MRGVRGIRIKWLCKVVVLSRVTKISSELTGFQPRASTVLLSTETTDEPNFFHERAFSLFSLTSHNSETACMDREHIADLVHQLNDVELAVLLSLVARKHCILTTEPECLELLRQQIELVSLHLKS